MTITPAEIDELERQYQAATLEEWWVLSDAMDGLEGDESASRADYHVLIGDQEDRVCCCHDGECNPAANSEFIAAAHKNWPDLIAAARRVHDLERENAHLRSRLKNSTMPLPNEQQLIDALERVKEAEALLKPAAFHMAGGGILSRAGAAEIDAWLKQAEPK